MRGQSIHTMPRTSVGAPSIWLVIFCFGVALDSGERAQSDYGEGGRARRQSLFSIYSVYLQTASLKAATDKSSKSISISVVQLLPPPFSPWARWVWTVVLRHQSWIIFQLLHNQIILWAQGLILRLLPLTQVTGNLRKSQEAICGTKWRQMKDHCLN